MSAEMKALGAPPIIETFAINPVGDGDICVDRGNRFAHERDVAKLHAWAKEAADAIERLTRERDEAQTREIAAINDAAISNREHDLMRRERDGARATLAAADKGTPIYKAVDRVLDEHSAWIARPSEDVTKAIALAAGVAWMSAEKVDPNLEEMDRALAAARAENDMLREALRPFGYVGDYLADETSGFTDEDGIRLCFGDSDNEVGPRLTHGDFRRARAALEQGGGNER